MIPHVCGHSNLHLSIIQNILGLCKVNGDAEFFDTNTILVIHMDRQ